MCLFFFTPAIPRSPNQHQFADVRNLFGSHPLLISAPKLYLCFVLNFDYSIGSHFPHTGVPNTLNVMTNFPFLVVGVLGFVFALDGSFFNIRF